MDPNIGYARGSVSGARRRDAHSMLDVMDWIRAAPAQIDSPSFVLGIMFTMIIVWLARRVSN